MDRHGTALKLLRPGLTPASGRASMDAIPLACAAVREHFDLEERFCNRDNHAEHGRLGGGVSFRAFYLSENLPHAQGLQFGLENIWLISVAAARSGRPIHSGRVCERHHAFSRIW